MKLSLENLYVDMSLGLTELIGVLTHSLVSIEVGNPVKVSLGPMQERIKRLV